MGQYKIVKEQPHSTTAATIHAISDCDKIASATFMACLRCLTGVVECTQAGVGFIWGLPLLAQTSKQPYSTSMTRRFKHTTVPRLFSCVWTGRSPKRTLNSRCCASDRGGSFSSSNRGGLGARPSPQDSAAVSPNARITSQEHFSE